jgi:hypothetical protein
VCKKRGWRWKSPEINRSFSSSSLAAVAGHRAQKSPARDRRQGRPGTGRNPAPRSSKRQSTFYRLPLLLQADLEKQQRVELSYYQRAQGWPLFAHLTRSLTSRMDVRRTWNPAWGLSVRVSRSLCCPAAAVFADASRATALLVSAGVSTPSLLGGISARTRGLCGNE